MKSVIRNLNKPFILTNCRYISNGNEQTQTNFGKDGHYDIIIVGGGATGISLAGSIGK